MGNQLQAIATVLSLVNPAICGVMFRKIEAGRSSKDRLADGDSYIAVITFAVWLLTSIASAQSSGPIVTDRPTQSVATFTLAPKIFEIEGGYKFSRTDDGDTAGRVTDLHELPDALFRFGLWRGIEARVTVSGWDFEGVDRDGVEEQSEAHEHGVAHLNVAVEGADLYLEFTSPAANIVGFEHAPRTDAQKTAVKEAVETLKDGEALIVLPAGTQCRLAEPIVDT